VVEASAVEIARKGQEGGRWVNVRPTGEEIAAWFKDNCELAEGLEHDDYVQGITLIQTTENIDVAVGANEDGTPLIAEQRHVIYVPYMKVETRVKYWHDLLALHPDWQGAFEPVTTARLDVEGYFNLNLPDHFFRLPVRVSENKVAQFIGCSMRACIYRRGSDERVLYGPPGTKLVNLLGRYGEDPNAVMKAETGAIGRALGMAGILVIPGSGVATAEDVQEAQAAERVSATGPEASALPDETGTVTSKETLVNMSLGLLSRLGSADPEKLKAFQEWARGRGFTSLNDLDELALRGVVTKLERELEGVQEAPAEALGSPEQEGEPEPQAERPGKKEIG
jgi:hypothetical protein